MQTMPVEEVEGHLAEVIDKMAPGDEIVLTREDMPVAILRIMRETPGPVPGRGKGMLTILSEDDDHLKDFAEYMP